MLIALTRAVPPSLARCELTHLEREPIDLEAAAEEHDRYERALESLGCTIQRLPPEPDLPDSVFVEDAAVVLDEVAVLTRPGAASRRAETESVARGLRPYRALRAVQAPGTLEGGDVLVLDRDLYVGRSSRTNAEGIRQLAEIAEPLGYRVHGVPVRGCLHLKTAVTRVADRTLLLNPVWIDAPALPGWERVEVDPEEPFAANALRVNGIVLHPAAFPRTRRRLEKRDIEVRALDTRELSKAESGLTCSSVVFPATPAGGVGR